MTVVVTAVFYPIEGAKDRLAEAMRAGIEAVHAEEGCELYAIHDAEDGTITMIEKWTSVEALDAHANGEAVKVLGAGLKGLLARPASVTRMTPIPMGTADQGAL
jgi:quinol monooxygenase YgiN